ncbi:MAG: hypothetical protein V1897_01390 [Pseudomonadota bacterium]
MVEHVRLSDFTIGKLRLLLFYDQEFLLKNVHEDPSASRFRIEKMTASWKQLVTDKRIKTLEIRRIGMAPLIYFCIINYEKGMFGYFWPRHGISGLEPQQTALVYSKSEYFKGMIRDSKQWFDSMWDVADKVA